MSTQTRSACCEIPAHWLEVTHTFYPHHTCNGSINITGDAAPLNWVLGSGRRAQTFSLKIKTIESMLDRFYFSFILSIRTGLILIIFAFECSPQ